MRSPHRRPRGRHVSETVDRAGARRSILAVTISLNGSPRELPQGATVAALLVELGLAGKGGLAVEVNAEVIPRSEHATTALREGDAVEVVGMMAGG